MAVTRASHGFSGLSTDVKPTPATVGTNTRAAGYVAPPRPGEKFLSTDTLEVHTYTGDAIGWQLTGVG